MAAAGRGKLVCCCRVLLLCAVALAAVARPAVAGRGVLLRRVNAQPARDGAQAEAGLGDSEMPADGGVTVMSLRSAGAGLPAGLHRFVDFLGAVGEMVEMAGNRHLEVSSARARRAAGSGHFQMLKSPPHPPSGPSPTHNR